MRPLATALLVLLMSCAPLMPPPPISVAGQMVEYRSAAYGANGSAYWENGKPILGLSVSHLDPAFAYFVWAHERCHLEGESTELAADCCAAKYIKAMGIPEHLVVGSIQKHIKAYGSDYLHPPGALRAIVFMECYNVEGP